MNKVYRRCCGIDFHKDTVVVCVLPVDGNEGQVLRKTYSTFRSQLTRMRGWLKLLKVTDIAMESTGVYWRPVWNVLEDQGFATLLLANPVQVKALAGRETHGTASALPSSCRTSGWTPVLYRRRRSANCDSYYGTA